MAVSIPHARHFAFPSWTSNTSNTLNRVNNSGATHAQDDQANQAHWSTYTFLDLIISALPLGVTTLNIYNNFKAYGNVSRIQIFDRRQDDRGTRAELRFTPPPDQPFWEHRFVRFVGDEYIKNVHVKLSNVQPRSFQVESPVHRGVMYNEQTELFASTLSWGFCAEPERMVKMATTNEAEGNTRLVLDLHKREIQVFFPFLFTSTSRSAVRLYRFAIALDDGFVVWRLSSKVYVFHLSSVPWYSKKLNEKADRSHSKEGKRWTEEDTWARQADICAHKSTYEAIDKKSVSLQKELNSINIARWTTFALTIVDTEENQAAEKIFLSALKDFNVSVCDGSRFKICDGGEQLDINAWKLLGSRDSNEKPLSLAEELSRSHLSFAVRYQLEVCLSHGWLSEYQITKEFLNDLASTAEEKARQILVYVDSYQQRVWKPMTIFKDLQYRRPVKQYPLPDHCMEIRSATVTATSILWNTPTVEVTNRVIRKHKQHADHFLRVRFEDDTYRGQSRLYATSNNKMVMVFQRVRRVLTNGIQLGDRHYEFLAWGNSQLREHGAYFYAKIDQLTIDHIRGEMGAFDHEKVVAKRAARMGQCFSTTKPVRLRIPAITADLRIPDVKTGKFIFTDGVGKISPLAAQIVHQQLRIKGPVPSVFQFRLGGCKGVLTVWPELTGVDVQVRPSQFKFESSSGDLEIIRWSEFWQPFLNRQIILCLSSLGVPTDVFLSKQEDTMRAIDAAMKDDKAAVKALRDNVDPNFMTLEIVELVNVGFRACREPFTMSILQLWKVWSLKYLKEKAKIPVPQGAFVLGCVDETNTLRGHFDKLTPCADASVIEKIRTLPEIFLQITDPQTNVRRVVEGVCVLARNPSLHRGDIRVVKAIDVPKLRHLCDAVVMPANGDRDLSSMCSGGDLDGDDYMVIWDPALIPEVWNVDPFHYNPPPPRVAEKEITNKNMIDFFYDYMQNDFLGRIATAHLAAADFLDNGLESQTCLELVELHSIAVDYPKTGVPARMERRHERSAWPHFMEKRGRPYVSHKVLGKLYDAVERIPFNPIHDSPFDKRILNARRPTEELLMSVQSLKQDYDNALQRIMAQHKIRTEFEVFSTFVLKHSKESRDFKFHEEIGNLSSSLKEQFHEALCELAGGKDFEHLAPVAVAAYQFTNAMVQTAMREIRDGLRYEGVEGMPFISFPWVLKDTLCQLARSSDDMTVASGSTAIVQNGNVVTVEEVTEFDEKGRAKIQLQGPSDIDIPFPSNYSPYLPDPYQPPGDGAEDATTFIAIPPAHIAVNEKPPLNATEHTFSKTITPRDRDNILKSPQQLVTEAEGAEPANSSPLPDPLHMTQEQLRALGLPDDMELL